MQDTVVAPMVGRCDAGYKLVDVPTDVMPSNGFTAGSAVPLCDGYWSGSCNSHSTADCDSGLYGVFYEHVIMAPMDGRCEPLYSLRTIPDGIVPNGFDQNAEVLVNQITHTQGDCPNGYLDLEVDDDTFFAVNISGTCTGGNRYVTEQCKATMPSNPAICGILCDDGLEYTDVGTCATICSATATTLRTSTGLVYPMYSTKQTSPTISIGQNDTTCYVNLVPGTTGGAINFKYNNQPYHAVR